MNKLQYTKGQLVVIYIAWWILWALVQTFVLHRMNLNWTISVADSFVSNTFLALICGGAIFLYRFYQPGASNRFYFLIFAIGATLLYCNLLGLMLRLVFSEQSEYLTFLGKSMPLRFVFALLMLSFVALLNLLKNIHDEQSQKVVKRNEAEQLLKEAELAKLRQQLQPHFLFNSLNSISALAGYKPEEARRMIQQLSDFLRATLRNDEQQTTHLKEELTHLKLYLEIEKVRFGNRLKVEFELEPGVEDLQLPPLLLQPVVENAVKFGLYGTTEDVVIKIMALRDDQSLILEISNPYDISTSTAGTGTGFGLSSVQRRLFLLYSRNDLLTINRGGGIFTARIKVPQGISREQLKEI